MQNDKDFDCVEMKNSIQEKLYLLAVGDYEKFSALVDELSEKSELIKLFKKAA
jgi:hypothetical protein